MVGILRALRPFEERQLHYESEKIDQCQPSDTINSRILERTTALPSAKREYGVFPAPFNCISYRTLVSGFVDSKRDIARC